jgi:hypothetical protein
MSITQEKGNLGLVKAIADLTEKGISVCIPISESETYDLIAEKDGICKRVQVRYASLSKATVIVKLRSIWTNGEGYQTRSRKKQDFDILAIYCPQTKLVYYIESDKFTNGNAIALRTEPLKVKNRRVRLADDYLECSQMFNNGG